MKKILMITTGGTIASSKTKAGFTPSIDSHKLLDPILKTQKLYHIDILPIMQIDSTNMTPLFVSQIAKAIKSHYDEFDAFIITHGTDTMAYTASLLSYMLKNLRKPVILTGSQIPMGEKDSDAPKNLENSLRVACEDVSGVFICFNGRLILGTRAVKTKTHSFDGFESINADYIAHINDKNIHYTQLGQSFKNKLLSSDFCCMPLFSDKVAIIKLSPAMPKELIINAAQYCDGLVIEAFGMGGVPTMEPNLQEVIIQAQLSNVIIAITTQCFYEAIDLSIYEVGIKMAKSGILETHDMTTESIVAKLMWAIGNSSNKKEAIMHFQS